MLFVEQYGPLFHHILKFHILVAKLHRELFSQTSTNKYKLSAKRANKPKQPNVDANVKSAQTIVKRSAESSQGLETCKHAITRFLGY